MGCPSEFFEDKNLIFLSLVDLVPPITLAYSWRSMVILSAFWRKTLFEPVDQEMGRSLRSTEMEWERALKTGELLEPRHECLWCVWRKKSSGRRQRGQGEWVITSRGQWQGAEQEALVCHTKELDRRPQGGMCQSPSVWHYMWYGLARSPSWFLHNIRWNPEFLAPGSLQSMQMF